MARLLIYLISIGLAGYCLYRFLEPLFFKKEMGLFKSRRKNLKENWIQVYETASWEEAHHIQLRLQEEGMECIVYEQGKKDIHGNPLRGIGIAVPKPSLTFAQKIISRIPV